MKLAFLFLSIFLTLLSCKTKNGDYVCTPCDLDCDQLAFNEPGICPHCTMDLVLKSSLVPKKELILNEITLQSGSGEFLIEGGFDKERTIIIHYYKPAQLESDSPIILVLPGAGRNGDDYRDAWIAKAEQHNILVLSPEYSDNHYPSLTNYNLAGMISDVKFNTERTVVESFKTSKDPNEWIYNDFDRIFNLAKESLELTTTTYDIFGHSAGGQIAHRVALFKSKSKANRILAANSGWYTVPDTTVAFPTGLKDSPITATNLDFSSKLVLFLGEKDDANETRGDLRRGSDVDIQGLHRFARGNYFYKESKKIAEAQNIEFNWQLVVIPNVGHDYRAMSTAAAEFLYGEQK